ncbi:MAG: folate-binding protein YgfZ [Steroidobacteraceae bacterium]
MYAESISASPSDSLGLLRARGPDVVQFLQGQLSNDLSRLGAASSLLAGYHNPQGRVLALLRLVHIAGDDLALILPRELIAPLINRLAKFVLRAKVSLTDESGAWRITPAMPASESTSLPPSQVLPRSSGAVASVAQTLAVCVGESPARWLLVAPRDAPGALPAGCVPAEPQSWQRLQIAAGLPQVYGATTEQFVAQMLNLDVLGAIAFDKGCYTGQEVIARAHYRGRVKRRMQRFVTRGPQALNAGDSGTLTDGRAFRVVEAVRTADGRCEFLAVAPLVAAGEADPEHAHAAAPGALVVEAQSRPLPYVLPE